MKLENKNGPCPKCGESWDDGDIYEKLSSFSKNKGKSEEEMKKIAGYFGWTEENKVRSTKLIGIEIREEYDGVSYYQCPFCKQVWDRWTRMPVDKTFNI